MLFVDSSFEGAPAGKKRSWAKTRDARSTPVVSFPPESKLALTGPSLSVFFESNPASTPVAQTSRRRFLSQLATGQSQRAAPGSGSRRSLNDLRQSLRGIHSYLPTPFHAILEIDPEGMRQNAAFYAQAGVQPLSLVVAAGLGELFSLGFEEHREVVSAAAEASGGSGSTRGFPVRLANGPQRRGGRR